MTTSNEQPFTEEQEARIRQIVNEEVAKWHAEVARKQLEFMLPVHNIEAIVTFGYMGVSPALLSLCTENNVSVCFLSGQGRFLARVSGKIRGNVLLRRQQYRYADDPDKALALSSVFVSSKIANCRNVVQRVIRDHGSPDEMPEMVSGSISLPSRGSFRLSLTVLVHYRSITSI